MKARYLMVAMLTLGVAMAEETKTEEKKEKPKKDGMALLASKNRSGAIIDFIKNATKIEAYLTGGPKMEGEKVGHATIIEGPKVLDEEQVKKVKEWLLWGETYSTQSSKGMKPSVTFKLMDDSGKWAAFTMAPKKGGVYLKVSDKSLGRGFGLGPGFRGTKDHPVRPFMAELFPNDPDLAKFKK